MLSHLRRVARTVAVSSLTLVAVTEGPGLSQADAAPVTTPAAPRPAGKLVPASGAYLGAYSSAGNWTGNAAFMAHYDARESAAGRKFAVANHFYAWTDAISSGLEKWDLDNGRIPLVTWEPTEGIGAIGSGAQDALIATQAQRLRDLGKPVFLRFGHEMNGNWYAWDGTHNNDAGTTNGPAKYIRAWRHVHDLFDRQGAANVAWVWAPNHESVPAAAWNHWSSYYPGDTYVDWVGIDGYNWGRNADGWRTFENLQQDVYQAYAARKPIMIAETASAEVGGDKATWIADMVGALKTRLPSVAAVVWFDQKKETDWRFDSSPSALSAFRTAAADAYLNPAPPPATAKTTTASAPLTMVWSPAADLSGARPLARAVFAGKVYIRAAVAGAATQVRFYLDDYRMTKAPRQVENHAPWDFAGGAAFDSTRLPKGPHHITVAADLVSGGTRSTTVDFTVA
jgi:hypothetical protein